MKFLASLILLIAILGCMRPIDNDSIGFNKMLNKFGTSIPVKPHLYFLIPQISCHGCVQHDLDKIEKYLQIHDSIYLTFISGIPTFDLSIFNSRSRVYIDSNNYLNELPFNVANFTIIKTENSAVNKIISLSLSNDDIYLNMGLFNDYRNYYFKIVEK